MKRLLKGLAVLLAVCCLCAGGTLAYRGYEMYSSALGSGGLREKADQIRASEDYVSLSALPSTYLDAVVAVEDHRFYIHGGIDLIAIGRAAWNNLQAGELAEGGSTITQQLAKTLYFTQEKRFTRKAAEVFMARALEKTFTKDEILELYVNSIYFGGGYTGVRQASLGYFGKEPSELTKYECTLLAGIPNAPSAYAPDANPELAAQRQRQVVRRMVAAGCLTQAEADALVAS